MYRIQTDRTAHILTHYLHISLEMLRNDIDVFAQRNKKWILTVDELDVQLDVYLKEIIRGIHKFDAMAIFCTV